MIEWQQEATKDNGSYFGGWGLPVYCYSFFGRRSHGLPPDS
jgi:hypothetical protein